MPGLSQKERVRRALVAAGPRGITAADFAAPHPIDGGRPIMRVAARIHELNDEGWPSVQLGERDSCGIYILKRYLSVPDSRPIAEAVITLGLDTARREDTTALFDRDTVAGSIARSAIFDDLEDAA